MLQGCRSRFPSSSPSAQVLSRPAHACPTFRTLELCKAHRASVRAGSGGTEVHISPRVPQQP
eukprot:7812600-Pyramimonas_sp.AAC.1